MARQGNYVTVPGSGTNWASGTSGALTDLSRLLNTQSESEKERNRLAAVAEEDKRRYEEGIAYKAASDAEDKRRYEEGSTRQRLLDKEARERNSRLDAEARRRFDLGRQDKLNKEAAEKASREATWSVLNTGDSSYTLADYPQRLQDSLVSARKAVESEKTLTQEYLLGRKGPEEVLARFRANLSPKLSTKDADELVRQRGLELRGLRNELTQGGYSPEQVTARIGSVVEGYNSRLAEIDDKVRRGEGLTKDDKISAQLRRIPAETRSLVDPSVLRAQLSTVIEGPTRESLTAQEKARVDQANATVLKNIDLFKDYLELSNKSGKSYTRNSSGVVKALESIGAVDIGWLDTADARKGFEALVQDKGVDPEVAAAAIKYGIDKGVMGDSFPSLDSKEFAELEILASQLQQGRSKGGSGGINRNAFVYKPEQSRGVDELQQGLLRFRPFERTPLNVAPRFALTGRSTDTPATVAVNRDSFGVSNEENAKALVDRVINNAAPTTPIDRYRRNALTGRFEELSNDLTTLNRRIADAQKEGGYYAGRRLEGYLVERDRLERELQRTVERLR